MNQNYENIEGNIKEIVTNAVETAVKTILESVKIEHEPLSKYEIERNKPLPNLVHAVLQSQLSFLLTLKYRENYQCVSELDLDTSPIGATPDLCIYY